MKGQVHTWGQGDPLHIIHSKDVLQDIIVSFYPGIGTRERSTHCPFPLLGSVEQAGCRSPESPWCGGAVFHLFAPLKLSQHSPADSTSSSNSGGHGTAADVKSLPEHWSLLKWGSPEASGFTLGSLRRPSDHSTLHQDIRGPTPGITKKQGTERGIGGGDIFQRHRLASSRTSLPSLPHPFPSSFPGFHF